MEVIKPVKDIEKRFSLSLLIATLLILTFLTPHSSHLNAADPQKKLSDIQKQIKSKKKRVKEAIKKERSVLSKIHTLNKNIMVKEKELKSIDKLISVTQLKILGISKDVNSLTKKLEKRKKYLKARLNALYKQQYGGYALVLFTAKDYQDLIRKSKYISLAAHHDGRIIQSYREEIKEIRFKKKNLEIHREKLETNRIDAKKKKKVLQTDRKRKDKLLATIRSKRSAYEKTIKELEKSSKKLKEMIKNLERQKASEKFAGKKFRSLKGHLPWPINGKVIIPYGKYKDPKFNITVIKNGIEIQGQKSSRPKAVARGRVVYADWFKGYGLLLIINHGSGYHTLYGNLSEIFHDSGDIINKGMAVGKIGTSSLLNVPTLYFEIRHKGEPVNPARWLIRKARGKKKL